MRYSIAALALAAAASAQSVAPSQAADSSCKSSYSGSFQISVTNVTSSKRDLETLEKRAALEITLQDGVLKDAQGRIGNIVANGQFQFDSPIQSGSIYQKGWAVCSNNTLVLGPYAVFEQCLSGNFYNLYLENGAGQCSDIYINVVSSGGVSQIGDGQVTASPGAQPVSAISDGQPQAASTTIKAPVTQISDGQIQQPTGKTISQISDGQLQAPVTTASPSTKAPVITQISDGQIQAPTSSGRVISQISDGQPQVPTNGSGPIYPTRSIQPYTGAAALQTAGPIAALAAGALAMLAL